MRRGRTCIRLRSRLLVRGNRLLVVSWIHLFCNDQTLSQVTTIHNILQHAIVSSAEPSDDVSGCGRFLVGLETTRASSSLRRRDNFTATAIVWPHGRSCKWTATKTIMTRWNERSMNPSSLVVLKFTSREVYFYISIWNSRMSRWNKSSVQDNNKKSSQSHFHRCTSWYTGWIMRNVFVMFACHVMASVDSIVMECATPACNVKWVKMCACPTFRSNFRLGYKLLQENVIYRWNDKRLHFYNLTSLPAARIVLVSFPYKK